MTSVLDRVRSTGLVATGRGSPLTSGCRQSHDDLGSVRIKPVPAVAVAMPLRMHGSPGGDEVCPFATALLRGSVFRRPSRLSLMDGVVRRLKALHVLAGRLHE